jgi:ATP-dependent DNA helicase RecQ
VIHPSLLGRSTVDLIYRVEKKEDESGQVIRFLQTHQTSQHHLLFLKKTGDRAGIGAPEDGFYALPYMQISPFGFGMRTQDRFLKDEVRIIVATVALGMGINKPDVRFVVHYDLPKNIEQYYQETGRAGRDGDPSECLLLYSRADFRKIEYLIEQMGEGTEREVSLRKLHEMVGYCESRACRRAVLLTYFGESWELPSCGRCDSCLLGRKTIDGMDILTTIVSCIDELGEDYGVSYLADIISGTLDEKVIARGHNALASFGSGHPHRRGLWVYWIRELISCGYLSRYGSRYPVVRKNLRTREALEGRIPVRIGEPEFQSSLMSPEPGDGASAAERNLYEILRDVRKMIADELNLPPFRIFPTAPCVRWQRETEKL